MTETRDCTFSRAFVAVVLMLAVLAGGTSAGAASMQNSLAASAFQISEVGLGKQPYFALKNSTKRPGVLGGLYLCQGSRCFALPKSSVPAGKTVRVATGSGAGLTNVVARRATVGKLRAADGEVALYGSRAVKDPKAMLAYLQWGSSPHALTPVALKAGLWRKGAYVASSPKVVLLRRTAGGLWVSE